MKKIAGIVWYNDEIIYRRALAIFTDALDMPSTYEKWMIQVKKRAEEIKSNGWVLVRAELNPESFPAWCKSRGLEVDAKARIEFGNEAAVEYMKSGKGTIVEF